MFIFVVVIVILFICCLFNNVCNLVFILVCFYIWFNCFIVGLFCGCNRFDFVLKKYIFEGCGFVISILMPVWLFRFIFLTFGFCNVQ